MKNPETPLHPYSKLGEIIYFYALNAIEEVVPYDEKSDVERAEIDELIAQAIETSLLFFDKFSKPNPLLMDKVNKAYEYFNNEQFDDIDQFLIDEEETDEN